MEDIEKLPPQDDEQEDILADLPAESDEEEPDFIEIVVTPPAEQPEEESEAVPEEIPEEIPEEGSADEAAPAEQPDADTIEDAHPESELPPDDPEADVVEVSAEPVGEEVPEDPEEETERLPSVEEIGNEEQEDEPPAQPQPLTQKQLLKRELIEWIKAFIFAGLIVLIIFGFLIKPVEVKGHSMEPTLQNGDRLVIWMLGYEPQSGDTVILSENTGLHEALVKRVIAVAGQTVEIDAEGNLLVDGSLLHEDYTLEPIDPAHHGDWDYPVIVPEGRIFVMGDNRNHSTDSRSKEVGFVEVEEVVGKVFIRIAPFGSFGLID